MTPTDKAKELYGKFYEAAAAHMFNESRGWYIDEKESSVNAKACAKIAIDEIIIAIKFTNDSKQYSGQAKIWQQVKDEIEKID